MAAVPEKTGLLISFDGLDSSGKATQAKRLVERLRYLGRTVHHLQSPDYTTRRGQELKQRLQNTEEWQVTPWEEKMHLFADNRAEHRQEVISALERGEAVVYDRYVPSSVAFVTIEALLPQETDIRRRHVHRVVEQYEYGRNRMPKENVSIFLDVPAEVAVTLLESRKEKLRESDEYTDHLHIQQRLYNEYDVLASNQPDHYMRIRCLEDGELLPADDVAEVVWQQLLVRFPFLERSAQHS